MIAILPAAGRGTRMASLTGGGSKEALPLAGRTVLDFVLDEAFAAGAERAIVVTAREKWDVEAIVAARRECVDIRYQAEPLGLAHAVVAADAVEHDVLVLLPDTLFVPAGGSAALARVAAGDGAILAQQVSAEQAVQFGILECEGARIRKIIEKPQPDQTQSRLAIAARFFLSDRIMRLLQEFAAYPPAQGEYDLTAGLNRALLHAMELVALVTEARRFDCGSVEGYREAQEHFGA